MLDAGCGAGRNSLFLAHEGCRVTGLDRSLQMVERGRAGARELGVEVAFLQGRLEALPLADASFRVAVCSNVLETMTEGAVRQAAGELGRVLQPEGYLLLVTAAQEGSEPGYGAGGLETADLPFKARLTTREELRRWFPAFELVELLHLQMEFPTTSPVRAQWAMVARRRGRERK
ncbi:MAG: class I SAM-dependent methyltransferase [Chloroflexi bacterium]|nr:class I SAM-dependent methyltransferase [Chloroflexota bacterium]